MHGTSSNYDDSTHSKTSTLPSQPTLDPRSDASGLGSRGEDGNSTEELTSLANNFCVLPVDVTFIPF